VNEVEFVEAPFIDEKSGTEYFSLQLHTVSKRAIPCLASSIASTHLLVSRLSLPLPTPPLTFTRAHTHTLSLSLSLHRRGRGRTPTLCSQPKTRRRSGTTHWLSADGRSTAVER
jgi:hypothetical protein